MRRKRWLWLALGFLGGSLWGSAAYAFLASRGGC